MKIVITEDQLKNIVVPYFNDREQQLQEFKEGWSQLSPDDRLLVLEFYREFYPEKFKKLNESVSDWFQVGLDVVGLIDPTGIADFTNSMIYFYKGEVLFGMLSLVSAVPYVGDAIAKPIMLSLKTVGAPFKIFKAALRSKNPTKIAEAAKQMKMPQMIKFIESFGTGMGDKILKLVQKNKNKPIVGRVATIIEDWVNIFKQVSKQIKLPRTRKIGKPLSVKLSGRERIDFMETLSQMSKNIFSKKYGTTAFRDMAKKDKFKAFGREFTKIWQVPKLRRTLGKTKFFLRFLDKLNMGNYVGPEELSSKIPNGEQKLAEFANTPEGQALLAEEFE